MILLAGMVVVASSILTLVSTETPKYPRVPGRAKNDGIVGARRAIAATVLCPGKGVPAAVRLGAARADARDGGSELTVLWCAYFGDGPLGCGMDCLDVEGPRAPLTA
jgi:hypothetical protein